MEVLILLLVVGAGIGHTCLLTYSNNWWFSHPLNRHFLRGLRNVHGLAILLGWWGFAWTFASSFSPATDLSSGNPWRIAALFYLFFCAALGLVVLPFITLRRLLRRSPACLLSNDTQTFDVTAALGYRPVGRGKWRALGRMPFNEAYRVDFAERTFRLPQLPAAWDGLSILHLSDLHFYGSPDKEFYRCVMDRCRDWNPDIVAITGDIVDSEYHQRWILPLLGRLRWSIAAFGILGNHDTWHEPARTRRRMQRLGIHMVGSRWEKTEIRGEPLIVIGHEGPWFRPEPDLTNVPAGIFRLCLSHTPDNIRWAQANAVDLMLAGHVHGGQIRFPVIGSVLVPSCYGRRYDCGIFWEPPTLMHVSRGLSGKHPIRYLCRPEVTKIVLRSA
jgi:predicted MPP superfamily phosphohydrolase